MTQLLLFDTPVAKSFAPITPVTEPTSLPVAIESPRNEAISTEVATGEEYQRGVNHMGDLARLVLHRYDLVAQRRAKRLAKESAAK